MSLPTNFDQVFAQLSPAEGAVARAAVEEGFAPAEAFMLGTAKIMPKAIAPFLAEVGAQGAVDTHSGRPCVLTALWLIGCASKPRHQIASLADLKSYLDAGFSIPTAIRLRDDRIAVSVAAKAHTHFLEQVIAELVSEGQRPTTDDWLLAEARTLDLLARI